MYPYRFIAFDGPDGVGKSTLIDRIRNVLLKHHKPVIQLHEWKGGPFESTIRCLSTTRHDPFALFTWVLASRCYVLETYILDAIKSDKIVLLDRYYASSLVYQRLEGIESEIIERFLSAFIQPDVHFYLTCPIALLRDRLSGKMERISDDRLIELVQMYDEAFEVLKLRGELVYTLDTSLPLDRTVDQVLSLIAPF